MRDDRIIELDLGEEDIEQYEKSLNQGTVSEPEESFVKRRMVDDSEEIIELLPEEPEHLAEQPENSDVSTSEEEASVTEPPLEDADGEPQAESGEDVIVSIEDEKESFAGALPETEVFTGVLPEESGFTVLEEEPLEEVEVSAPTEEFRAEETEIIGPEEAEESVTEPEEPIDFEKLLDAAPTVSFQQEDSFWNGLDPDKDIYEIDPITGEPIEERLEPEEEEAPEPEEEDDGAEEAEAPAEEEEKDNRFSAVPVEREKVEWYLSLPFITVLLCVPILGWIAAAVLFYLRFVKYRKSVQVKSASIAYIFVVSSILIIVCLIYLIVELFPKDIGTKPDEPPAVTAVSEHGDRDAAESQARAEAESKDKEALAEQERTRAHADIGVARPSDSENPVESEGEPEGTAAVETENGTAAETQPAQTEALPEETHGGLSIGNLWENLTGGGSILENDTISAEQVELDRQEMTALGDNSARYSLQRLASSVTLMSAIFDERFYGERQALFSLIGGYQGMEISSAMNVRSNMMGMVSGNMRWEATLGVTQYRYVGSLENGQPNGMGMVLAASSMNPGTYIPFCAGTFANGALDGYGMVFREIDGTFGITYEGYFEGGKYSGKGSQYLAPGYTNFQQRISMADWEGTQYSLEDVNWIMSSYASRYAGAMAAYQVEGQIYAYVDVPILVPIITESGRYANGKSAGYCVQYGPFGRRIYAGVLQNGTRSGTGTSYYENGTVEYEGEWRSNRFDGAGILYTPEGTVRYQGEFKNGDIKAAQ